MAGVAGMALAMLLVGCATEAEHRPGGATFAFESIDGPPRVVFDRLVERLDAAARARQVAVVSRRRPARYRVRAYLAVRVESRRTAIAWVLDVYDSSLRRATRISGEEPAGGIRPDAWEAVDGKVLARIAEAGMAQLADFAAGSGAPPPAEALAAVSERAVPEPAAPPARNIRVAGVSPAATAVGGRVR